MHAAGLPDGFFARLGTPFLREYHDSFRTSPFAVLAVTGPEAVSGFAAAVLDPAAHARWVLRRHGLRLAVLGATGMVLRPPLLALFVRTRSLRYARGLGRRLRPLPSAPHAARAGRLAVLSHIVVDSGRQRGGTGAALVATVRAAAIEGGASGMVVLTAPDGPGPGFYRRLGFTEDGPVRGADGGTWRRFRLGLP